MADIYFENMRRRVKELCPTCSDGEITHVCNLLSNKLRSLKCDIYGVEIDTNPSRLSPQQYSMDEVVTWKGKSFYLRIVVD